MLLIFEFIVQKTMVLSLTIEQFNSLKKVESGVSTLQRKNFYMCYNTSIDVSSIDATCKNDRSEHFQCEQLFSPRPL